MYTSYNFLKSTINIKVLFLYLCIFIIFFVYFDKTITHYIYIFNIKNTKYIIYLNFFLYSIGILLFLCILYCIIRYRYLCFINFIFISLCIIIPDLICKILKVFLGRARPELFIIKGLYGFYGFSLYKSFWSLPSGHVTHIMGIILGFSIFLPKLFYFFISFGIITSLSRVYVLKHYLSDIIITIYITALEVNILFILFRRNLKLENEF